MLGIKLVVHAVKILFYNIWATVRLTLFPMIIGYGIAFGIVYLLAGDTVFALTEGLADGRVTPDANIYLATGLAMVVMVLAFCWAAVGWHRFVLLDEQPGALLPSFGWSYIKSYYWACIRIFLVVFAIMFLMTLFMSVLSSVGLGIVVIFPALFLVSIVCYVLSFRFSLILPGAAVGKPMSLVQSWNATRGQSLTFLIILVLMFGFGILVEQFLLLGFVGTIIWAFLSWLGFAFGISILTTFYGIFVEKRDL